MFRVGQWALSQILPNFREFMGTVQRLITFLYLVYHAPVFRHKLRLRGRFPYQMMFFDPCELNIFPYDPENFHCVP